MTTLRQTHVLHHQWRCYKAENTFVFMVTLNIRTKELNMQFLVLPSPTFEDMLKANVCSSLVGSQTHVIGIYRDNTVCTVFSA